MKGGQILNLPPGVMQRANFMDEKHIRQLLENVRNGSCDITEAMQQ